MHLYRRTVILPLIILTLTMLSCKETNPDKGKSTTTANNIEEKAEIKNKKTILFYGDSLTAGYGLDEEESYPSLIQEKIDIANLDYAVINAGLSGETTSGGLKRIDWVLNQRVDVFVLALGANDMLRGLPVKETKNNLQAIIDKVKAKYPEAAIAVCQMLAAPNMGKDYSDRFSRVYTDLAKENSISYIPFFLEGVAGNQDLLLRDGKHPNSEGQVVVANNLWKEIPDLLK